MTRAARKDDERLRRCRRWRPDSCASLAQAVHFFLPLYRPQSRLCWKRRNFSAMRTRDETSTPFIFPAFVANIRFTAGCFSGKIDDQCKCTEAGWTVRTIQVLCCVRKLPSRRMALLGPFANRISCQAHLLPREKCNRPFHQLAKRPDFFRPDGERRMNDRIPSYQPLLVDQMKLHRLIIMLKTNYRVHHRRTADCPSDAICSTQHTEMSRVKSKTCRSRPLISEIPNENYTTEISTLDSTNCASFID